MRENELVRYIGCSLPDDIERTYQSGDLDKALSLIDERLETEGLTQTERNTLTVYRELISRIPRSFLMTDDELYEELKKEVPSITREMLKELTDGGQVHYRLINGKRMYFDRAVSSLLKGHTELYDMSIHASEEKLPSPRDYAMNTMKAKGSMSERIHIRAYISVEDEYFTPGEPLRVHLPIPRENSSQSDIVIEKIFPEDGKVSSPESLFRAVCWEEAPLENRTYSVEYSYTRTQKYTDLWNDVQKTSVPEGMEEYLKEEAPQIVFSPLVKATVKELTEGTDDPLEKARRIYDHISLKMKYSFMPQYFVIPHIADDCLTGLKGDCGVFALTMITMLRCAGIPAKWQSGLAAGPDSTGNHDWLMFCVEPYGWVYADPSYATGAVRDGNEERRKFYFGNLDPWRMAANDAFEQDFEIPKERFSSDPYDSQTGEIESDRTGFTRDELIYGHTLISAEEI